MRPVRLVMQGFGAYRDRTEVNFDGVELFALTGPTGAGKSTVVDAICMALYGSVPRYDDQRLIAPAISQGLSEATVYLEFIVEGVPYTAVRVIRRTPTGGAATKEARLERRGEVIASGGPELTERIVALLGLSFEHFTRCVVLPQGQFAKFLHDKPRDRQELLKTLLDITVYEQVATAARDRAHDARARAATANDRLSGELASATPERRTALAARAELLDALYQTVRGEEEALRALTVDVAGARDAATALASTAATLQRVSIPADVSELVAAVALNRELSSAADADAAEVTALVTQREQHLASLGDVTALRLARQAHEQLDELAFATPQRRAELVARVAALTALYGELQVDEGAIAALAADAAPARRDATVALAGAATLSRLAVPPDVGDLVDRLASVTTQLADVEAAVVAADDVVTDRQTAFESLGDIGALMAIRHSLERRDSLVTQQRDLEAQRATAETSLAAARAAEQTAVAAYETARLALDAAKVVHQAHALRPHLVLGQPCPVCEHTVVTLPPGDLPVDLAKAQSAESDALKRAKSAESATAAAAAERQRVDITLTTVADQIVAIDAQFEGPQSLDTIDAQLAAIAEAASELDVAKKARAAFEQHATQLRAEEKKLRARETKARSAFLKTHAEVSALGAPIPTSEDVRADWDALVGWASAEAAVQSERAAALVASAEHAEVDVAARREAARSRCGALGVTPAAKQLASEATFGAARSAEADITRLDDALTAIERLHESLRVFAAQHPTADASLAAIEAQLAAVALAATALDEARSRQSAVTKRLSELRAEQRALSEQEASARNALSRVHAELAGMGAPLPSGRDVRDDWTTLVEWAQAEAPVQSERASMLAARADELTGERDRRQAELIVQCEQAEVRPQPGQPASEAAFAALRRAGDDVERIDEQLATVDALRSSVAASTSEAAVADELARLLKADHFEKWLLDDVMKQLVEVATITLMELSSDQFSLTYDDGDFMVIDHKNADQMRQAKTLSGGETFLASLSLALSLADQLANFATGHTVTLDALFLDEGFGTLDADTLDVVASAIEDLGSRGRMVGLISHVPELADRVPVRFEVRKIANASHIEKVLQ